MSFLLIIALLFKFLRSRAISGRSSGTWAARRPPRGALPLPPGIYGQLAELVRERPGVVVPFRVGETVEHRPIWGFRVRAGQRARR
jgi:hypothetical protein